MYFRYSSIVIILLLQFSSIRTGFSQTKFALTFFGNNDYRNIMDEGNQLVNTNIYNVSVMTSVEFKIKNNFSILCGLHLKNSNVGYRFVKESYSNNFSGQQLLELPINICYNIRHNKCFLLQTSIGFKPGYVRSPLYLRSWGPEEPYNYYLELIPLSEYTFGIYFGLSENVRISKHLGTHISLGYNFGLNEISRVQMAYLLDGLHIDSDIYNKNRYAQIGIGLQYYFSN